MVRSAPFARVSNHGNKKPASPQFTSSFETAQVRLLRMR
jgi:hypothetical protein